MKVYIGPYLDWLGPYQIAEKILFWKDKYSDDGDIIYKFGEWLATDKNGDQSRFSKFCNWVYSKQSRKIKIKVHDYDLWNLDSTLSPVIYALLTKFAENIHSVAMVDKSDVPEELHCTYGEAKEEDGGMSALFSEEAWKYVINEMIYAFDPEWDDKYGFGSANYTPESYKVHSVRQQKGFELFGKYFTRIWN